MAISLESTDLDDHNDNDNDDHNNNEKHGSPDPVEAVATRNILPRMPLLLAPYSGQRLNEGTSFSSNAATRQQPRTFTPTNPFANPEKLYAMKR